NEYVVMVALIMPHPETGARWKGLQHYTEHFMAPVNKSEEAARLLEELTRYKVVQPSVPPLENLTDHYVDYAFQTAEEGKWNLRLMQPPQKGFNYVNGNHREMSRLEHRLAERQS